MAQASMQTLRHELAHEAVQLAHTWVRESADYPVDPAAERLAGVLKDPNGLPFTVGFVDGVMRPEDLFVAGYGLQKVAKLTPKFLPWYMRAAIACGGVLGPVIPGIVIPISRRVLREMVGHLVVDATPQKLGPAIAQLRADGSRLNLNLLGEAVLGEEEAQRRFDGTLRLLERDDVDYVSIKVSSIVSQLSLWAFDEAVEHVVEKLIPLYRVAADAERRGYRKFINLDMEEYRDLDLTIAVFTRVLEHDDLKYLEAGIVLQSYLPDALAAMQQLTAWARLRRTSGGAPIKARLVKGANIQMENVDAQIHGWPNAPYSEKQDTDANFKRVLEWSLTPENTDAVRIGVAGHNLFDVAYAWLLAQRRGVTDAVEFEMLLGMATGQAQAVRRVVGNLLLYTPVVNPHEFDVAISYLIRRLEENASPENYMSVVFELHEDNALLEREAQRFLSSVEELGRDGGAPPEPNRTQNRQTEWTLAGDLPAGTSADGQRVDDESSEPTASVTADVTDGRADEGLTQQVLHLGRPAADEPGPFDTTRVFTGRFDAVTRSDAGMPGFHNTPDTDPAIPANREWGRGIISRMESSSLGIDEVHAHTVTDAVELERIIETVRSAGAEWGAKSGADRSAVIERAADTLSAHRDRLLEVMGSEAGKTIGEGDPEVSEAIDFAHYYAAQARQLDRVQGAVFEPSKLIVVTPPWNFPLAIPSGGVLAGLASGAGVILKPAPQAERTAAVMVEALWEAGVPRELLAYVSIQEGELGKQLISHDAVDRVILTGAWDTAKLFRSWRPTLPLLAETSGKNALVVMPSADMDLAAADLVKSAFGHAGQKCSASSLVILVGSAAKSERFHRQLVDAAMSLRVGYPSDPSAQMGPIIEPAEGKLLHALTELGVGEEWLVEPKRLDRSGQLWSPGIRTGVKAGSYFHLTEFFGPVLGVMHARTLGDAIRYVNAIDYGLTSGLHTQDSGDLAEWLAGVEAGNLYVNRGITGAIVQRQPFGGWKRSSVGAGTKAGGPSYLYGLGSWRPARGSSSSTLHLRGLDSRITRLIEAAQPSMEYEQFDVLRRSALSDAVAWANEYGEVTDATGLDVERNLLRYRPVPVAVRAAEDAALGEVLRVVVAGVRAKSRVTVSTASALPTAVLRVLDGLGISVTVEFDAEWVQRTAHPPAFAGEATATRVPRVRLVGSDAERRAALHQQLAIAVDGDPDVAVYAGPVTQSGRIEMLPFLREQAISITAHRFGNLDPWSNDVI
ncbi:bifunctional proline dehydrogenase/L-glutamate gamma-semialdehyde dehydrogenase [Paramicrobacterium chengjingii]|uniref:L-glutamate gamma-semialdehyde dehydrogenase n=1 Tax=Paramicrobacterium chengjingii TaxID=2769067 RepID=A0ABX6YJ95_9MICO|nr:bifunctional proline dehydrogenase/L-glutamate gamma-semialdehyde dehydrogenase [Microbacterium chengjingii]QPZ38863.1 bifunctional proline dehydrogenase/L-glutamate gamma-semialdehyde dehydrogenase [Microbacterium chengjingii]